MPKDLISIVMSVRNAAPYLEACLDSVLEQTEMGWELLVVNNHSTDNSLSILESYAQKDLRIRVFINKGETLIEALRMAYAESSGQLITRMDGDDLMVPKKLGALKQILLENGPGHIATGKVHYFADGHLGEGFKKYEVWLNCLMETGEHYREIYRECVIPSPCWMVFRDDFEHAGAYLSDRNPEDYDLCFRFYKNKLKVIGASSVLHHWRDYPDRASRTSPEYADHRFMDIKMTYFLALDYDKTKQLVLWGAGSKGKEMAKRLQMENVPFIWVTNNERKIGITIYGSNLHSFEFLEQLVDFQTIVSVAAPKDQKEITAFLSKLHLKEGEDYYFFC